MLCRSVYWLGVLGFWSSRKSNTIHAVAATMLPLVAMQPRKESGCVHGEAAWACMVCHS
jgi:hypothetical protein